MRSVEPEGDSLPLQKMGGLSLLIRLMASLVAANAEQCAPVHLRVNCPGTPGGRAGCLSRGCCYNATQAGDWCSHYTQQCSAFKTQRDCPVRCTWSEASRCTGPAPPPPPPPPSPVAWAAGPTGERVLVHASGAVTAALDGSAWLAAETPYACLGGQSARVEITVSAGRAANGSDPRLGGYQGFEQTITAPAALRGGVLSTRYFPGVTGGAAFEFGVQLAGEVTPGSGLGACHGQPIVAFPFGGQVLQQNVSWLSWRGEMARHTFGASRATDTGPGTAPLVLAAHQGGAALLVAPADEFLTTGVSLQNGMLTVGPEATLSALPAGYSYSISVTLSSSRGVTQTVKDWGRALQLRYGTLGAALPANPLNTQLSYTTALGEYFDYLAWPNITGGGETYPGYGLPEEALLNVSAYFKAEGMQIKLFVLDICTSFKYVLDVFRFGSVVYDCDLARGFHAGQQLLNLR